MGEGRKPGGFCSVPGGVDGGAAAVEPGEGLREQR